MPVTIAGIVRGNTLTGVWMNDNGESGEPVDFLISANGMSFSGRKEYEGDDFAIIKKEPSCWAGVRVLEQRAGSQIYSLFKRHSRGFPFFIEYLPHEC